MSCELETRLRLGLGGEGFAFDLLLVGAEDVVPEGGHDAEVAVVDAVVDAVGGPA